MTTINALTIPSHFGPEHRTVEIGQIVHIARETPLRLECGAEVRDIPLAFQQYGTLNAAKSNAILVFHALTGDQYAAGTHPVTGKPGWWERVIGPGKILDTNRYAVICCNVLGGCMGSFGPKTTNPATGAAYALQFPVITIGDMVRAQKLLLEALGIENLFCVIGGSMGGMQVLEWAAQFPESCQAAIAIATTTRHSAQNIAFHEIGRQAIMADPDWRSGDYTAQKTYPSKGLSVARMAAHVTYVSEHALQTKFGRTLQDREQISYGFEADFQIESYLRHQGTAFVERFDANSYLYITRAMDYFDLSRGSTQHISVPFKQCSARFCVFSFTSDWLYPTEESRTLVRALNAAGVDVTFREITTDKGHDAFLLQEPEFEQSLQHFIEGCAVRAGL